MSNISTLNTFSNRSLLSEIRNLGKIERDKKEKKRLSPAVVRLWDGDWKHRGLVSGDLGYKFEFKYNDVGTGEIVLPGEHHLATWAMGYWKRNVQNIHITVDKDGLRWSGRMDKCTTDYTVEEESKVTLTFLHDLEELKHIQVWSNPGLPAAVQFPKRYLMAAPTAYGAKLALFLNIGRLEGSAWHLPDDPLDPASWLQGLNYKNWRILVKPQSLLLDDSPWSIINSRFNTWWDACIDNLNDAQLMIHTRRWLEGDPQPWAGAGLTRNGQLIVDIVDKSGWFGETSIGGTIFGGLFRTGYELLENGIDEIRTELDTEYYEPDYEKSGFLGTKPKAPWVVYRAGEYGTVTSSSFAYQPATDVQVNVGGSSMPGINEVIALMLKLPLNMLGALVFMPTFGEIIDGLVSPLYSDIFMAFQSVKSPLRAQKLGWGHYFEYMAEGSDKSYTINGLMSLRQGFWETRQRSSHQITVANGAPYLIGENGFGHFSLGDRIGVEIPGSKGQILVEQVKGLTLSRSVAGISDWEILTGDPRTDEGGIEKAHRQLAKLWKGLGDLVTGGTN